MDDSDTAPFTPLVMFTCTDEVLMGNIGRTHEELSPILGPLVAASRGPVKAINSNFVHSCQPGYERFLKHPKPPTPPPANGRAAGGRIINGRRSVNGQQLAPANIRQRKPQGDATCFNSALELTIIPGPEDDPPPGVRAVYAKKPDKYYAVKSFPSTGQTQVPGVVCPDLSDGLYVANLWAAFLTEARVGVNPDEPVTIIEERPIMVNFKFRLNRQNDRVILNLTRIVEHLETLKETDDASLPYPIREIKHPQDGQNLSFKFVCPTSRRAKGPTKKVRVNIFYRGKVNILGASDFEAPQTIHSFITGLIIDNWDDFVGLKPLPDRVRQAIPARVESTIPIPPENHMTDEELASAIADFSVEENVSSPCDVDEIMTLAADFGAEFGFGVPDDNSRLMGDLLGVVAALTTTLDDSAFDQVKGQNVEDHEEDSLDDDAV